MPPAVAVDQLSKQYRVSHYGVATLREALDRWVQGHRQEAKIHWALRDVTFTVEQGSVFGIIGHNGAGKSTLLRLMCGLGRPTTGQIVSCGQINGILDLGGGFHPDLTGRENIRTVAILNGLTEAETVEREKDIISFAELEDAIDNPVRTYSNGMYVRLAFSAAMEFDPTILLIDEVLSVGDERFQQKSLERIIAFRERGKTLIITSHNTDQILALCDEVLVLEEGCSVMQGDPKSALSYYHDLMQQRTEKRKAFLLGASGATKSSVAIQSGSGTRQGTQEAMITAVRLLDAAGGVVESFQSGNALLVELDFILNAGMKDVALTLGVFSEAHVKCFEAIVPSVCTSFGNVNEKGQINCELKGLNLLPGTYFINVGLYPLDWSFVYDFHWQMHPVRVEHSARFSTHVGGIVAVDTTWHLATEIPQ